MSRSYGRWRPILSFPYYQLVLPFLRRMNLARPSAYDWAAYYLAKHHIPITGIVDVGAFEGQVSVNMAELFPNVPIYSFEPSSAAFAQLARTAQKHPRIKPFQLALSDQNGRAPFNLNRAPVTNSILPILQSDEIQSVLGTGGDKLEQVSVETIRLDDFLKFHASFHPTLLKTDTQGFDLNVLKGAHQTLQSSIHAVISEVRFFSSAYEGDTSLLQNIDTYLAELGFYLVTIPSIAPNPATLRAFEADGVWVR